MARLDAARALLERAVADRVTPGAQLSARFADGARESVSVGSLDYGPDAPAVTARTVYDLASITKVFTALALVRLAHREGVDLARPIAAVLPYAANTPAADATLLELLSHRAGLVHWAPFYRAVRAEAAGTPESRRAVLAALLATPRGPVGTVRYSDLGYMLVGEALAALAGDDLDAVVRREVIAPLGLNVAWRGVEDRWRDEAVAPSELCAWRGAVVRGRVHDENAYALGGVCGHAGLFGTADALRDLGERALACLAGDARWFDPARMAWMIERRTGGAHRVGWDARSEGSPSSGARMGPRTFGHLGFTGTSLWCDPDAGVVVALVTNRVHPTRENRGVRALRPAVHDAVIDAAR
jgi:CubicO group peptidase (beta-lactamase class C family)